MWFFRPVGHVQWEGCPNVECFSWHTPPAGRAAQHLCDSCSETSFWWSNTGTDSYFSLVKPLVIQVRNLLTKKFVADFSTTLQEIMYRFNPQHSNINMHLLHIVLYTFPKMLTGRISLIIKNFLIWWSFLLFSWPWCEIQGWYCKEKLNASPLLGVRDKRTVSLQALTFCTMPFASSSQIASPYLPQQQGYLSNIVYQLYYLKISLLDS